MTTWLTVPVAQFADHAAQWEALNRAGPRSPLFDLDFVQPLLAEFCSGAELLAIATADGGAVEAMAVLVQNRAGTWDTFQPSQAPLGLWINRTGADLAALLGALVRKLPGFPLLLALTQCDPFLIPRPAATASLRTVDYVDTARITVRGSFDEYWNARGKNLRANLKKQRNRLLKEGIATRVQISREPEQMAAALADYGSLESAGWKAASGTAIHPGNAQGRFYRAMLERFCRRGCGSVIRYWFNDKVVAMNLCIEGHGRLVILKTTYDEQQPSHYSPAILMQEETCRQLFDEQRFDTLEFYGKVMEWHLRWTDEVRTLYHVNTYRWPALLRIHAMLQKRAAKPLRAAATAPVQASLNEDGN